MISVYNLKPKFQQLLSPVLHVLHRFGITANQITLSSLSLSLIIGVLFWFADEYSVLYLALPVGLFVRMALNALDGMMARTFNQQSRLGEMLNEIGDVVSDMFVFFPLLKFEIGNLFLVAVFLCMCIVNEFSGLLGKVIAGKRRYDGPMGKSDRAFVMGVYGLLCFAGVHLDGYAVYVFIVLNVLLVLSTFIRLSKTLKDGKNI